MADVVFMFPGQGSQYVGMGRTLWEAHAGVKRLFEEASDHLGLDLKALCFEGPDSLLIQTDNVQPAITLVNLAWLEVLRDEGITPAAAVGHSLGEYAALCAAGVFTVEETLSLVAFRGRVMKEAADREAGGMIAVFGLDMAALTEVCQEVSATGSVEVANHNSPTQVTLTGEKAALKSAAELAKKKGAKLTIPLKVSGAWHSRFMAEARDRMRERLEEVTPRAPSIPVIANVTAKPYPADADTIRSLLTEQIVRPVLWYPSIARLRHDGFGLFVEAGPGKVLVGLMKDIDREAERFNVDDAAGLDRFRALAGSSAGRPEPS